MNVLDTFSGIGGFSLGLERAGMRTIAFCENNPRRRELLAQRWPGVPIHTDVRELADVPADVVCGGFPCQDVSRAGRRAGLNGERSGLWRELIRLIAGAEWGIVENIHQGWREWVPVVRSALHELGYASVPLQMRAVDFGLPHRRSRVFVVAHAGRQHLQQQRGGRRGPSRESALLLGQLGATWRVAGPSQGIAFPRVDRAGDGIPDRVDRNSGLGNAIVPACAEFIGRAIMKASGSSGDNG